MKHSGQPLPVQTAPLVVQCQSQPGKGVVPGSRHNPNPNASLQPIHYLLPRATTDTDRRTNSREGVEGSTETEE